MKLLDRYTAGIQLFGTEIKSVRKPWCSHFREFLRSKRWRGLCGKYEYR